MVSGSGTNELDGKGGREQLLEEERKEAAVFSMHPGSQLRRFRTGSLLSYGACVLVTIMRNQKRKQKGTLYQAP
jgi:hypothetical protein